MAILADDRQNVPVTVTLRAETLMQFMVWSCSRSDIPASECHAIKDAITSTLKI